MTRRSGCGSDDPRPPRHGGRAATVALTIASAAIGATAATTAVAHAASAPCSQKSLQTALNAGGRYAFNTSCTLDLTKTLKVPAGRKVTLDANGHQVTINGESPAFPPKFSFLPVFVVSGSLELDGLTVAHGTALGTTAGGGSGEGGGVKVVSNGELTTDNVVFSDDAAIGAHGTDGPQGQSGGEGAPGAVGGDGEEGVGGGDGGDGIGGAVYVASDATATLMHTVFSNDVASGGTGGGGSPGGSGGQGGDAPTGSAAGGGGNGANGSDGGGGGEGKGGAVFSAGDLTVIGGSFKTDHAVGGSGGTGGTGGPGGAGGHVPVSGTFGNGGNAADGGNGGDAGDGTGGAIASEGPLRIKAASFTNDRALGGAGGNGAPGGPGGSGSCPSGNPSDCGGNTGGDGGDGGDGGQGANGDGGAIDAQPSASIEGVTFAGDKVGGGQLGLDCPISPVGSCGGTGGDGGGHATTLGSAGSDGSDGGPGSAAFPRANVKTSKLAPVNVTTTKLSAAKVKHSYSDKLKARGGIAPYRWKAKGLPAGLKLHATSGKISGTPKKAGTSTVHVTVSDPTAAIPSRAKATLKLRVKR